MHRSHVASSSLYSQGDFDLPIHQSLDAIFFKKRMYLEPLGLLPSLWLFLCCPQRPEFLFSFGRTKPLSAPLAQPQRGNTIEKGLFRERFRERFASILHNSFLVVDLFLFYVFDCLPACMSMYRVCLVPVEGTWLPGTGNKQLWAAWLLGSKPSLQPLILSFFNLTLI